MCLEWGQVQVATGIYKYWAWDQHVHWELSFLDISALCCSLTNETLSPSEEEEEEEEKEEEEEETQRKEDKQEDELEEEEEEVVEEEQEEEEKE